MQMAALIAPASMVHLTKWFADTVNGSQAPRHEARPSLVQPCFVGDLKRDGGAERLQQTFETRLELMDIKWHTKQLWQRRPSDCYRRLVGIPVIGINGEQTSFADHAERRGLHILPVHYYTPVPNGEKLPESLVARTR